MTLALLTTRLVVALPTAAPPIRKNTSLSVGGSEANRLLCMGLLPTWSNAGEFVARVEEYAGDHDPLHIGNLHSHDPVLRNQRCDTEAEHHSIGIRHVDSLAQVIDTRSQDQILAARQRAIDGRRGIARLSNEELADRQRRTGRWTIRPGRVGGVRLYRRDEDVIVPAGICEQVWRFAGYRTGCQRGVWTTTR